MWYAAYGSNLHVERFDRYRLGGAHPGGARVYPGFRDPAPPLRTVPLTLPGLVYFATESPVWGGGRAFYDPDAAGEVAARGYLLGREQFADLLAQEMYCPPGEGPAPDIDGAVARGRARLGDGRYETLVRAGEVDGLPVLTFTAPWGHRDVPGNAPSAVYLRQLAAGLVAAHGWTAQRAGRYLAACPGAAGRWSPAEVAGLLEGEGEPGR
ncbi:histone deacetylase [Streptomyces otsuchiensis]|uniref:histone deacetylase n=1 Tax=Streptomyces otsuchiensis TaxID=2681388 RepID=UPI0010304026|nr:histone deacetylase [Streptomyces otsuchiensis]